VTFLAKHRMSPERNIQVALVKHLTRYCALDVMWWAVPNGGHRHLHTAIKLRAEGVQRGVPDLCFLLPGGKAGFLELKTAKGRASPEQVAFGVRAQGLGALWALAYSLDDALVILNEWGVLRPATVAA
jgi:hypothetical protein